MKTRLYDLEDYPIVKEWWEGNGLPVFPADSLSPVGFIADDQDMDVAAVWLYMAVGVGVCWKGGFVANPDASDRKKVEAFNALDEVAVNYLLDNNYGVMVESYTQPSLVRLAQKRGAVINHSQETQLVKVLREKEQVA